MQKDSKVQTPYSAPLVAEAPWDVMVTQRIQNQLASQDLRRLCLPSMLEGTGYVHLKCVPKGVYFGQGLHNSVKSGHV